MKKVIAWDTDGVIFDYEGFMNKHGDKFFKLFGKKRVSNEYDIEQRYNCSKTLRNLFWLIYIWPYCLSTKVRPGVKEAMEELAKEGYVNYNLTGRVFAYDDNWWGRLFKKMLIHSYEKNNLKFEKIIIVPEKGSDIAKLRACLENNISIVTEDKLENINELTTNNINVLSFNADYNTEAIENDYLFRVNPNKGKEEIISKIKAINTNYQMKKMSNEEIDEKCSFKRITARKQKSLTNAELIMYYKRLREYYKSLEFDKKWLNRTENNFKIAANIIVSTFKTLTNLTVINKELATKEAGVIYASNHLGSFDQFLLIGAVGNNYPIHFLAKDTLLKMKRGLLYKNIGCVFVNVDSFKSKQKVEQELIQLLLKNKSIGIYPEGTRNRTEKFMLDFDAGVIDIAKKSGRPIVPLAVDTGTWTVKFGEKIYIGISDDIKEKQTELRDVIATLYWEILEENKNNEIDVNNHWDNFNKILWKSNVKGK